MFPLIVVFWLALARIILAVPAERRQTSDAPFSVPASTLAASITCPRGFTGAQGGVVFLIHGTGSSGSESWSEGPYNVYLPYASPGFDVCWVDLPLHSLGDAQVSAEYVAYNIPILAKNSATGKISVIGHSQGAGLNIQWALDFWPSTRQYVSDYIALAGDFHGTAEGPVSCTTADLTSGGCHLSVIQQTVGSHYLAAQNERGGSALVTTTSLYTHYDDIIQPEVINPTSILTGATNYALQDSDICGPTHLVDHFEMITDPAAYALAYDALTHSGGASASRFDSKYCLGFANDTVVIPSSLAADIQSVALDTIRLTSPAEGAKAYSEPPLKAYVCTQGQATSCGTSN